MSRQNKQAVYAIAAVVCVLLTAAFYPAQPRAGWWCTTFSVICEQTASEQVQTENRIELRSRLADWLHGLIR